MVGAAEPEQRENEKNKRLQRTRQHMSTFANFFLTKIAQKKLSQAKEFLLTLWENIRTMQSRIETVIHCTRLNLRIKKENTTVFPHIVSTETILFGIWKSKDHRT